MQIIDYDRLKDDYPEVEFVGLVGFDTKRQQFVLLTFDQDINNDEEGRELSKREREVLQLVTRGFTNLQIAQKLVITEYTVKAHLQNIFAKLKVGSRTEAAMLVVQRGWMIW
jgi:DNA-binding NarL/FixJ family response regulator